MKLRFTSSLQRRLQWFNLPTAMLIALLQRTPVIRMVAAIEECVVSSPVSAVLKSIATAAASLGAINSMAGATPLVPSSGTESGITVTVGASVAVAYTANSPLGPGTSWAIAGTVPPGLSFSGEGGSSLMLSGIPTTAGSFPITIKAFGPNNEEVGYAYTITVLAGGPPTLPAFTTQPAGQTVSAGANVTFTVAASGSPTPTLQWKKGTTDIPGATSTTLTLNNVQTTDSGSYTAVATNSAGSVTSNAATLTVNPGASAPAFTTQPVAQSVATGGTATFTVAVSGSPTPTIQWRKGATDIAGATGLTLTLLNVQASDGATYTAVATNSAGTATSTSVLLTVTISTVPSITAQPQGHSLATGSSVVFNVGVSGGGLSYQWKKNGAAISGATSAQYLISNAQPADAGSYTVTATNGSGSATSTGANLTVAGSGDPGRLVNASVRIVSGTGADVLIVGFVTGGSGTSGSKQLLIRGIGPTLTGFGVPGAMADPLLEIIPSGGTVAVASNDNWGGDALVVAKANAIGAFPFPSATSKDAALLTTLAAGVYSAKISGVGSTTGTVLAEMYDANPSVFDPTSPRIINLSARATMANDNPLIAGFVIGGSTAKTLMIRAIGPTLTAFGVPGAMADPSLEIIPGGGTVAIVSNDNWGGAALLTSTGNTVGAFALSDSASKDAVILVTLDPGVYSAKVVGVSNSSGITLIEMYEIP
ncbi:MAG: hypothetical protein JWM88_341 [Verrucomicrobia bacterium]|nr:hypothetical protein [Verrucomicrobiota bacterium]